MIKLIRNPETGNYTTEDGEWLVSDVGGRGNSPYTGRSARLWKVSLKPLGNLVNVYTLQDAKRYISDTMANRPERLTV